MLLDYSPGRSAVSLHVAEPVVHVLVVLLENSGGIGVGVRRLLLLLLGQGRGRYPGIVASGRSRLGMRPPGKPRGRWRSEINLSSMLRRWNWSVSGGRRTRTSGGCRRRTRRMAIGEFPHDEVNGLPFGDSKL